MEVQAIVLFDLSHSVYLTSSPRLDSSASASTSSAWSRKHDHGSGRKNHPRFNPILSQAFLHRRSIRLRIFFRRFLFFDCRKKRFFLSKVESRWRTPRLNYCGEKRMVNFQLLPSGSSNYFSLFFLSLITVTKIFNYKIHFNRRNLDTNQNNFF